MEKDNKVQNNTQGMPLIITNRMYCGGYLLEGENIGHEVINVYKDDNGDHYIYINDDGKINTKYDKYNDNNIVILLTRYFSKGTYQIIAKAKVESVVYNKEGLGSLKYGGKELKSIYENNTYHGKKQNSEDTIYATYKVQEFRRPKNSLYITDDKNIAASACGCVYFIYTEKGFSKQSQKQYFKPCGKEDCACVENPCKKEQCEKMQCSEKKCCKKECSYNDLYELINNDALWNNSDDSKKVETPTEEIRRSDNFMSIIKKADDELSWSNLLAYIFESNKDVFCDFVKEKWGIKLEKNFTLLREKNNIDMLIFDNNNVIVIENKIKSGINGIKKKNDNNEIVSQLSTYFDNINNDFEERKKNFIILMPDYKVISLDIYKNGKDYKPLKYSDIKKHYEQKRCNMEGVNYFNEFLAAIEKQSRECDNELELEMERRFRNAIFKA